MTGLPGPVQQGGEQKPAAVNAPSTPPLPTGIFEMPIQPGGSLDLGPLDRQIPDQFRFRSTVDSNDLAQLDALQAEQARRQGEAPTIDDLIEADRQQENSLIALHFREAAKANPDIAGEAQRLGVELEKMGATPLRPIIVERNIDKMRQILAERRAMLAAASVDSPTIRRQMTDPDFARIASDQTQQLGFFEGLGKNWTAGRLGVQRGLLGDRFRRGIGTESDLTELERVQEELGKLPASSGNIINGLFRLGGQFRETMPRAFVAAGAGAGTAVALGQLPGLSFVPEEALSVPTMASVGFLTEMWASSAKQQSGAMYLDMVKEGFDPYTSANISGAFGIAGGLLDVVGFGSLVAQAKNLIMQSAKKRIVELLAKPTLGGAAMAFGKNYTFGVGGELGAELLQTVNEIIAKEVARPSGQPRITPEELGQQLGDTIVETFNMTAIFGGLAPSARFMSDRRKVEQGKRMAQTIQQFLTKADEVRADWTKRNGEAFGEATEEIIKATGAPGTFYVEASKVGDILRQSDKAEASQGFNPETAAQVDAEIPGFSEAVAKAEAEGGDVEIPAKLFVQKFGDTAFAKSLAPHLRSSPEALSAAQVAIVEKTLKQADDKAERALLEDLAAVQDSFQQRLTEAKTKLSPTQVRYTAQVYRLMVEQIAREEKIPVSQAATLVFGRKEDAATGVVANPFESSPEWQAANRSSDVYAKDSARLPLTYELVGYVGEAGDAVGRSVAGEYRLFTIQEQKELAEKRKDRAFRDAERKQSSREWSESKRNPNILRQPGRGGFDTKRLAALFDSNSDPSTVVHELTHWHVEMMARLAANGSQFGTEMFGTLLKRWNITREEYDAMTPEQRKPLLEDISYNAEEYFATGKAPSADLRTLFEKLRSFLLAVYTSIRTQLEAAYKAETGRELPALTPELRGYFDRMLASRDAIATAEADRDMAALFQDEDARKAAGVTDEKWAAIQKLDEQARDEAIADLSARAVRGLGAFDGARMRTVKAMQQKLKATRAKVREQAEKDVRARPVYAVQDQIRYGEAIDEQGNAQSSKLDTDTVREILGDEAKLDAYYSEKEAVLKKAEKDAVAEAGEIAKARAGSVSEQAAENASTLRRERSAEEQRAWDQANEEVLAKPVHQAIKFMAYGTVNDNGKVKPAKMDRSAVRVLAGKTALGKSQEVFNKIPANVIRKDGVSPDVIAAQFGFANALTLIEEVAKANFDKEVEQAYRKIRKASGLFDKSIDTAAVRMAAEETVASPAAAKAAFSAGASAARAAGRISRPELVADLLRDMTRKNGIAPDLMASMFGFSTGEAMLREILNAPPLEAAIEAETNKRMEADHSELADPKKMQQAVLEALHGEARGKLIASELKALLKATAPTQSMLRAAKEAARQRLQDTPVGQISARSFAAAASRAARAARDALASGDVQEAIDAQRQYLFQNELARQSIAIEKEVDRFLDGRVAQVFGKDEDLLTTRNMDVVNVARGLLGEHDLSTVKQYDKAMSYLATLKDRNPEAEEKLRAFVEPVAVEAKPWRQLTLERFRALASATDALWHESKRGQEFRTYDGELLLRSTVRERLIEAAQAAGLDNKKAAAFGEEAARWSWADIKANLTRIEQWTITMDGGKEGGVWHRYVYRTVAKAYNNYLDASLKEVTYWRDTLAEFDNLNGPEIDAAELGEGIKFRNREHLLGTIVHIGNESNLTNVVLSEGWGELQQSDLASAWGGKKSVLVTNLWKFINRALRDGHLTRKDFDTIQTRIWDHNEKVLKPLLDDTNREVYGTYVATIKPTPFAVEIGGEVVSYRGGYVPSKVDPNAPGNASLFDRKGFDSIMDGEQQFHSQFASVPRGSTIARKENVVRKRVLSLKLQGQHVDEVLRFGHIQPALTDVAALFRRGPLADFLNRTQPAAIQSIVAPALERVARNRIQAPMAKNARVVELAANALRRNASAAYLGFSIKNYLQQYTGVIQSLNYVSAGRMWDAFWAYRGSKGQSAVRMFEMSSAMRNSLSTEMQAVQDEIALLYDPSALTKVRQWSNRYMMVLQRWAQFQVNTITWNAAFDEQYAKLLPEMGPDKAKAEAVERADSIVRRSQGSRTPLDVANFSAGNAVMQLFTQFQDFPNLIANQIMEAKGVKAKAAAIALSLLLPTLASGAIALGLAGGRTPGARTPDGDDDRDGRWDDEAAAYLFGEVMRGTGSLLPIIGAPLMERMFGGSSRAELAPFPSWGIGESMFRQVARTSQRIAVMFGISEPSRPTRDGAWSPADARDWSIILGAATGLPTGPVGRAWSFAENVESGRSEAGGAVRTILGILNGR